MMSEDAEEQFTNVVRPPAGPTALRRPVRLALGAVCAATATAAIVVAGRSTFTIAILAVLLPGFLVAYGLILVATAAPAPAPADARLRTASRRLRPGTVGGYPCGESMTVCKTEDRWFLENEHGELVETPFREVVEWLDTLWDIRQLAPTRPEADPELILFKSV